jgi:hypothetical protein
MATVLQEVASGREAQAIRNVQGAKLQVKG